MATHAGTLNNKGGTARPNGRDGQATRCSDTVALLASVGITCVGSFENLGDRIFIYKPEDMPMTWKNQQEWQLEQEENLLYVALTRSKSELFIVGYPDWYTPPATEEKAESAVFSQGKTAKPMGSPQVEQLSKKEEKSPITTDSKNEDFFSLVREAREKLDAELTPIFKNKASRAKFIKTVIDDDIDLGMLEESGKIKYTSEESKKAVYTAIDNYWVRFGIASRIEEDKPDYKFDEYDF